MYLEQVMDLAGKKIVITGATGFLGTHLQESLSSRGLSFTPLGSKDYDLTVQTQVEQLFSDHKPDVLFHFAGYSGGIKTNKERPAEFYQRNILMNTLTFDAAYRSGVEKMICVMGGCSYPATAPSPIPETEMWNGYPQFESAPYSTAKKMLIVSSEAYRRQYGFNSIVMIPGNVYGPYDNFNLNDSHVIPALVRKIYEATRDGVPSLTMWGSGKPTRDFIYARDAVDGVVKAAETYESSDPINISSGTAVTIRELVETTVELTGFAGEVIWDTEKPDGQMYKGFDVKRMHEVLGYHAPTSLRDGLVKTVDWLKANYDTTARL
jgi:GDP-L-fucose synthase